MEFLGEDVDINFLQYFEAELFRSFSSLQYFPFDYNMCDFNISVIETLQALGYKKERIKF